MNNIHKVLNKGMYLSLLLIMACTPYYIVSDFESRTVEHKKVAILPFEMLFTGKIPADLTEEDVFAIEEAESRAFQMSFYNEILRSTKSGRKPIKIELQPYNKTLNLLSENDISIRESWIRDPQELAELLGVDAVIIARIEKMRFMSDLASYGIELGVHIANIIADDFLWPFIPPGVTTSKEILANYVLTDAVDGTTLWSISFQIDADWRSPANEIIESVNRRSAKKFPYRINK